jgi:alpha/beta superfamily hydrolase
VFRRFASLCRDQNAACDAAFRFGALVGADAAMRCASPTTVSLASRKR